MKIISVKANLTANAEIKTLIGLTLMLQSAYSFGGYILDAKALSIRHLEQP